MLALLAGIGVILGTFAAIFVNDNHVSQPQVIDVSPLDATCLVNDITEHEVTFYPETATLYTLGVFEMAAPIRVSIWPDE